MTGGDFFTLLTAPHSISYNANYPELTQPQIQIKFRTEKL